MKFLRKFFIILLIMGIYFVLLVIVRAITGTHFDSGSYGWGFATATVLFCILDVLKTHLSRRTNKSNDEPQDGVKVTVTVTVKDANDPEQVGEAISAGLKAFNSFYKLGNHIISDHKYSEDDPPLNSTE